MGGLAARAAENFDYYAGVVSELHGRSFQVGDEFVNYTVHKPVGVAALIMPWNAPLMLRHGGSRRRWRRGTRSCSSRRVVAADATALAQALEAAEPAAGFLQRRAGFGETAGAPLSAHPGSTSSSSPARPRRVG